MQKATLDVAYHVTPAKNVQYIEAEGLIPSIGDNSSSYGETEERTYFFPTISDVEDALLGWLGEAFEDEVFIALLKVDTRGVDLRSEEAVGFEVFTNSQIPPEKITVLSHDIDQITDWSNIN